MHTLPLQVIPLQFRFRVSRELRLRPFNAAVWRGALGHALRSVACVTGQPDCSGCLLREGCAYSYLFETPPPSATDRMRRYTAVPHPMILRNIPEGGAWSAGDEVALEVLLLGQASEYLAFVIHAFERVARTGLGSRRQTLELIEVEAWQADRGWCSLWQAGASLDALPPALLPPLPALPDKPVAIDLLTPLRLVSKGRGISRQSLRPEHLWRSLTRRISMLCYFHGKVDLQADYKVLHQQAENLDWLQTGLRSCTWKRYSSRQRRYINLPGIIGRASIDLSSTPELWPWLWWGQWLHAGKATVMGLGQYRVTEASLPNLCTEPGCGNMRVSGHQAQRPNGSTLQSGNDPSRLIQEETP